MQKRLHRSRTEKMIAGVCGGLSEYFDVDPTLIRIGWVLISLLAGVGVLLYIVMWVITPLDLPAPPGGPPTQRY
jgi:phage shock protein C